MSFPTVELVQRPALLRVHYDDWCDALDDVGAVHLFVSSVDAHIKNASRAAIRPLLKEHLPLRGPRLKIRALLQRRLAASSAIMREKIREISLKKNSEFEKGALPGHRRGATRNQMSFLMVELA